jgi:predicted deacylase
LCPAVPAWGMHLDLGTASAAPGEFDRGTLAVTDLPTGTPERLPVVLANGAHDGPTCWVTAGVHGDEVTALAAAQDAVRPDIVGGLHGQVVCLPCLNPAGLRRTTRTSYYHDDDPNRVFPDPAAESSRPPRVQELVAQRIYDAVTGDGPLAADALLDCHTAHVGSMPFVIRDRVLHGDQRDEAAAETLASELDGLVESLGLPVVTEYEPEEYVDQSLQRSTAGAALNAAGVPACTLELGSHSTVDEDARAAGVAAIHRALVHLDCLDAVPAWADADPIPAPVDHPVRRHVGPRVEDAGVVRATRVAGDTFETGDAAAALVTPAGEQTDTVRFEHDGYVLGRQQGVAAYENDPVYSLAVRDDAPLVAPRDHD